jgi:4-hydroxybenzoate polyprenyltransferase
MRRCGQERGMIGLTLAVLAVGIVLVFILPWVGVPLAIVGAILVAAYLIGFGRRAAEGKP